MKEEANLDSQTQTSGGMFGPTIRAPTALGFLRSLRKQRQRGRPLCSSRPWVVPEILVAQLLFALVPCVFEGVAAPLVIQAPDGIWQTGQAGVRNGATE